jgi:competence protein ComEA
MDARTRIGVALVALMAIIAIIAGVAAKKLQGPPPIVITDPEAAPNQLSGPAIPSSSVQSQPATIYVHVAGAVKNPALYQLNPGARLFQALKAAGGPKADADIDAVNLAEKLSDGEKVYVPTHEEMRSPDALALVGAQNDIGEHSVIPNNGVTAGGKASVRASSGGHANKLTSPSQGTVDINTASAEELQRLPGVGPAMAARILAFRQSAGRFRKIEDLMEVSGIGPKKFAKMKRFVRI